MQSRIPRNPLRARERRLTLDLGRLATTQSAMLNNNSLQSSSANLGPSRCGTPTNPLHNSSMNGSLTLTLPRERPTPSPKCFGKNTHVLKEDYERERVRWEKKLDEAEQKLSEATVNNSEQFQLRAELNRKIIDFEKSQRPLIEQNRRLNDRIKAANAETRKLEDKLAHVQDELLSLRDCYERVQKENAALREQRAFPEKLEELSRYRAQVLEMSKCITALRQSAAEKDRRHELLVMKVKRMRRAQESDRQSCAAGSEGSVEDSGSLGLDTIAEDLDEDMELSAALSLMDGRGHAEYVLMRQQLEMANEALADIQREMDRTQLESANRVAEQGRLRAELEQSRRRERAMEQQLANVQAQNELLEFQLVELTATQQQRQKAAHTEKMCATETSIPVEKTPFDGEPRKRHTLSAEWTNATKEGMRRAVDSPLLPREDRLALRHGLEAIDCLREQVGFVETELNMAQCENSRLARELEAREADWARQQESAADERNQKKRELKADLERERSERREEQTALNAQVEALSAALGDKVHALSDLSGALVQLQAELDICRCQLGAAHTDNGALREQFAQLGAERERLQSELASLRGEWEADAEKWAKEAAEARAREEKAALELGRAAKEREKDRAETDRLRNYNRELEAQFNEQMEMLGALKRKLLAMQDGRGAGAVPGGRGTADWAAARSCGSTEDEQYHSEGSDGSLKGKRH